MVPDDLPLGYHRVRLRSGGDETSAALIVTPAWLGVPERLGARRTWGLATQLYSVRSRQSWGVGDLTDLTDLADLEAAHPEFASAESPTQTVGGSPVLDAFKQAQHLVRMQSLDNTYSEEEVVDFVRRMQRLLPGMEIPKRCR